jgi:predicted DNA-binding transcriptional regulator AlpA
MQRIALSIIFIIALTAAVAVAPHLAAIEPSHWSHLDTATLAIVGARSSFTIEEFCRRNGISKSFFYKLRNMGKGPRLMDVGSHKRVSVEAEVDWKLAREADASEAA